jgi:hypothetical protein
MLAGEKRAAGPFRAAYEAYELTSSAIAETSISKTTISRTSFLLL